MVLIPFENYKKMFSSILWLKIYFRSETVPPCTFLIISKLNHSQTVTDNTVFSLLTQSFLFLPTFFIHGRHKKTSLRGVMCILCTHPAKMNNLTVLCGAKIFRLLYLENALAINEIKELKTKLFKFQHYG